MAKKETAKVTKATTKAAAKTTKKVEKVEKVDQTAGGVGTTLNMDGVIKAMCEKSKEDGNEYTEITQKDANQFLHILKDTIADGLARGQKVQLTGFMSFTPSYRSARKGNNVITNESMDIPEGVVVSVKAGKFLKDVMKNMDDKMVQEIKADAAKAKKVDEE